MPKAKPVETLADWRTIENEREKYAAYLCSREWGALKEAVHKRSRGTCERCGILPGNAVHHLTYERKYHEEIEDLQHTCHACHDFTHGKSDFDPIGVEPGWNTEDPVRLERWTAYLQRSFGKYGRRDPVPGHWAYFGWIDQTICDAAYINDEFLAVVLLKDLAEGKSADVWFDAAEAGTDNETSFTVCGSYEKAIETLCLNLDGIPNDTALWIRWNCPECPEGMYDESIRQVRKCLPGKPHGGR